MVSYIVYPVICSPRHTVFLRLILADICSSGLLIFTAVQCSYDCVPHMLGLSRGFPHLDSYQRSQDYSHLSWADTDSSQAENKPPRKKNCVPNRAWNPSAPSQLKFCIQSCEGHGLASWCKTSTSEREQTLPRSL